MDRSVRLPRDLTVAVVGVGKFGEQHVTALRDLGVGTLVGVDPAVAAGGEQRSHPVLATIAELLATRTVDCAIVASPSRWHAVQGSELLRAGIPCLVEKPMAEDLDGCRQIAEAAVAGRTWCQPGHVLRFSAAHRALSAAVRSGAIGEVETIASRRDRSRALATLYPHDHPALLTSIHDIDLAHWLAGAPTTAVRAVAGTGREPRDRFGSIWIEMDHANAVKSFLRSTFSLPAATPDACGDTIEVYGSEGIAALDVGRGELVVRGRDGESRQEVSDGNALIAQDESFLQQVARGDGRPEVSVADGTAAVAAATAVIDGLRHGAYVPVATLT